jgi:sulfite exporter TauE/SafE
MILEPAVLTALATGALGSTHCAAMCGPLAVAGCSGAREPSGPGAALVSFRDAAGYFGGRLVAYATVGAVVGHLGRHALCILPMGTLEAVAVAAVAAAAAYRGVAVVRGKPTTTLVTLGRGPRPAGLLSLLAQLWPRRGLGLGLATGVLPCGLLVPAWALAAGTASAPSGATVMAAFAVATMPGLWLPLAGGRLLRRGLAKLPPRAHGWAWCLLAVWIALRPLLVAKGACHF